MQKFLLMHQAIEGRMNYIIWILTALIGIMPEVLQELESSCASS